MRHVVWMSVLAMAICPGGTSVAEQDDLIAIPRAEHPRPDFRRDTWHCLNGTWQFRFDPEDRGLREAWHAKSEGFDRRIVVPFCWESRASGIAVINGPKIGWYRRQMVVPREWKGNRILLRFEAVDWEARIWVGGKEAGRHEGGYTPFAIDITDLVEPGEETTLVVRVFDPTDPETLVGKQGPPWYTPTSGIWQTVWLEARPEQYIDDFRLVARNSGVGWALDVEVDVVGPEGPSYVEVISPGREFLTQKIHLDLKDGQGHGRVTLDIPSAQSWSPEDPHLYDLDLRLRGDDSKAGPIDRVHTYFGLRTIESAAPRGTNRKRILLNGEPIFLRGTLDQSFNPEGICTAPTDAFIRRDLEIARGLGGNFLRLHVKAEEPRRLYWADRLGLLVMEDMPCARSSSEKAWQRWSQAMRETIRRDHNHPSVIAWSLFNESWGLGGEAYRRDKNLQQWVFETWTEVKKKLDPTRLVDDDSAVFMDHVQTDVNSWHFTIEDFTEAREHLRQMIKGAYRDSPLNYVPGRKQDTEPLLVSEFSGVGPGGGDRDVSWSFRYLTNLLRQHDLIHGYVYAQLFDVEWEHNGLVNYDRTPKEFGYDAFVPDMTPADLQRADYIGYDAPPVLDVGPEETFTLPVFISHYSNRREAPRLRWQVVGEDDMGQSLSGDPQERQSVWQPHQVMFQQPIKVTVPTRRSFVGAVTLELFDKNEERIAANYVNLVVRPVSMAPGGPTGVIYHPMTPRVEVLDRRLVALRFSPDDFTQFHSDKRMHHWLDQRGRFYGYGQCEVQYNIVLPGFVRLALPTQVLLMAELATKADNEKSDWPEVRNPLDCPQTEKRKYAGRVGVFLEDKPLWRFSLPDDPADSRGVLSHQQRYQHGAYGYLVRQNVDLLRQVSFREKLRTEPTLRLVFRSVPVEEGGKRESRGISLFGERLGRYPIDPTLIIQTSRDLTRPPGWTSNEPIAVGRLLDRVRRVTAIQTGETVGHPWRYTTTPPPADWAEPAFDDAAWTTGKSAFGVPGTPGLRVATPWTDGPLWMRTQFDLPTTPVQIVLRCFHRGGGEVFINGQPVVQLSGNTRDYDDITLDEAQRKLFIEGTNTIAVCCTSPHAVPALDVGLRWASLDRDPKGKPGKKAPSGVSLVFPATPAR
ncbi:MAG: hypothetical protein JW818_17120 [Pirellulales bacterium]|nr:hypothetical protein [Pirellulales bacterium]